MANQSQSGFITRGISGTLEAVVPLDSGGFDYFRRVTTDESDPSKAWVWQTKLDTGRPISSVSMILSNYGKKGELIEIVARIQMTLFFYSLNQSSWTWSMPIKIADDVVTGNPALIQRNNGEFHLVVPLLKGGLAHYWRKNDNPDPKSMTWNREKYGTENISAVSMIESDYGNLELVAKEGDKLVFYQRTADGWNGPHPMECNSTVIDGVTGSPALIQSVFATGATNKNFELVVPRVKPYQGNGLVYFWRNNDSLNDDPTRPWIGPILIADSEKLNSSVNSIIRRNGGDLTVVSQVKKAYYDLPPLTLWPSDECPTGLVVTSRNGATNTSAGTWGGKPVIILVSVIKPVTPIKPESEYKGR